MGYIAINHGIAWNELRQKAISGVRNRDEARAMLQL